MIDLQEARRPLGDHEGGTIRAIEQGQLTDAVPCPDAGHRILVQGLEVDQETALEHHIHAAIVGSRGDQELSVSELLGGAPGQALDDARFGPCEESDLVQWGRMGVQEHSCRRGSDILRHRRNGGGSGRRVGRW